MAVLAAVVVGGPILISLLMSTDWSLCCPPGTIIIISQIRLQMRSPPPTALVGLGCYVRNTEAGRDEKARPPSCGRRSRRKDSEVFDEKTPLSNICGLFNIYVGQGTHIPPTRSACLFMATPQADSFLYRLLGTLWSATD